MKLLLFDIDGTVLDSGGAGSRALTAAFNEVFSVADAFADISMAGKTDGLILREAMRLHDIPENNGNIPALFSSYEQHLRREMQNGGKHLKPGFPGILRLLMDDRNFSLGLLTGNIESGARIKLDAFGLNHYFPVGAFGSDNEDRNELLPTAVRRFRAHTGVRMDFADCVVIGDTPRDVECARPYGAQSVAVATGPYNYAELSKAGAGLVLEDLSNPSALLDFISASSV